MVGWGGSRIMSDDSAGLVFRLDSDTKMANMPDMVSVRIAQKFSSSLPVKVLKVARNEVTFNDWQICYSQGGCLHNPRMRGGQSGIHPVTDINWFDALQYVEWLSAETNQSYRLPTDEEWKFLAKDVVDLEPAVLFDDPRMAWAAEYASYGSRPARETSPVGAHGSNRFGINDLAGNVWEWTSSCWRNTGSSALPKCGGVRVLQGEHRSYQSEFIRTAQPGGCFYRVSTEQFRFYVWCLMCISTPGIRHGTGGRTGLDNLLIIQS